MADAVAERTWQSSRPLDLRLTFSTLRRGPGDPAHQDDGLHLWRTSRMPTGPVTARLRQLDEHTIQARAWGPGADEHLTTLPQCLGEGTDLAAVPRAHPVVADGVRRFPGLRVPHTSRVMEALVPAILEQKVLGVDAFAAWRRLLARFGAPAPGPGPSTLRVVPDAAQWAALPAWEWHRGGVDPQRYRTVQAVARVASSIERLAARADSPDSRAALYSGLRSIPGVGAWTCAEVGSRALGDPDAVPFGDYHLARTVGVAYADSIPENDDQIAAVLEPFRPHRFLALRLAQLSPLVKVERRGHRFSRVDHRAR